MFKFFRKYNKYILAVGGTLLLIMFLINVPFDVLIKGIGGGGAPWATVGPKQRKVTHSELSRLQRELKILDVVRRARGQLQTPEKLDRAEYWYLLVREAEEAGLVAAPTTVSFGEQDVAMLSAMTGEHEAFVRETLARYDGVVRLIQMSLGGGRWSDRRLKHAAQRTFLRVAVQPVVIQAVAPAEPPAFSDDELQQQMDKYAGVAPGAGDMGFGYLLPDRAKLEWLAISAESVRAMIEGSGKLNPVALRKHWRLHQDTFGAPQADADVPEAVRTDFLKQETSKTLDEIARDAGDRLRIDRRELAQRGGYFEVPEGWTGLSLQNLALELQRTYGVDLPEYQATGDRWLTESDLAGLPGIGTATTTKFGDKAVGLAQLVMAARELRGSSTIPMQTSIAGPVLRASDGSVYIFRITAADKSRPPRDLDEVREQVVADLARLTAYRRLAESAQEIRSKAVADGMLAVAIDRGTTVGRIVSVTLGTPTPTSFPGLGPSKEAAEAIIDHALSLPQDKPIAELTEEDRVIVVPVEAKLALLVVRITDLTPVTAESYRNYADRGTVQNQLLVKETSGDTAVLDAFKYAALAARHNFKITGTGGQEPEKAAPAQASTTGN